MAIVVCGLYIAWNARDRFGNTALLLAALSGRAKTVKVLLDVDGSLGA